MQLELRILLVLFSVCSITSTQAAIPPSVQSLLAEPVNASQRDASLGVHSVPDQQSQAIVYIVIPESTATAPTILQHTEVQHTEVQLVDTDSGGQTLLLAPAAIRQLADAQQLDPLSWLATSFPTALHMGVIRAGAEEPGYEQIDRQLYNSDDIPLSFPEIQWLGVSAFWKGGVHGEAVRAAVLDSGFKSIVPRGFIPDGEIDDDKYRIHPAFTDSNGNPDKSIKYRSRSPELDNPYYGFEAHDPELVKKQYQIHGLRSAHGTQISCALTGGDFDQSSPGLPDFPRAPAHGAALVFDFAGDETVQIDPASGEYVDKATAISTTLESLAWLSRADIDLVNYSFGHGKLYAQSWDEGQYDAAAVLTRYSAIARAFDRAAYLNDFLLFKSAGNRSLANDPYAFTLTEPADNYNGITVGNMNPYYVEGGDDDLDTWQPRSAHHLRLASGRGPSLDGRRKPDIVAPGSHVVSCTVPFIDDERDDYRATAEARPVTGTSIASPLAGSVTALIKDALLSRPQTAWNLSQQGPRYSMASKAVLINSAENRTPSKYESKRQEGALGREQTIWPDPSNHLWNNGYGFGYVDGQQAALDYKHVIQDAVAIAKPKSYRILNKEGNGLLAKEKPLKVTLVWEKRFPAAAESRYYDYGYPLTPMAIGLSKKHSSKPKVSDTSLIAGAMTRHRVGNKTQDYIQNSVENPTYIPYNNVLQLVSPPAIKVKDACITVSVMDGEVAAIIGQHQELFALASNYSLEPVESCAG